jgi:hypothetical protein
MAEKYKYRLTWSGRKDSPALRAAVEHLKVFPLFKDSDARLITRNEYETLVALREIAEPKSYWQIDKDKVGLISLDYYSNYSKTWEAIGSAKGDFEAGWKACEFAQTETALSFAKRRN